MAFLPMNIKEVKARGWDEVDFVYVMGDSYVDHPSFGAAIITRVLEDCGYRVAVLSQPDWKNDADFLQFGKPRLGFFVTAGNIDSMVAHYTVAKRKRSDDAYTAGGKNGKRPDRAVTVYSNIIRRLYPDSVIIIGGLEASLRRFAHYDYWKNSELYKYPYHPDVNIGKVKSVFGNTLYKVISKRMKNNKDMKYNERKIKIIKRLPKEEGVNL